MVKETMKYINKEVSKRYVRSIEFTYPLSEVPIYVAHRVTAAYIAKGYVSYYHTQGQYIYIYVSWYTAEASSSSIDAYPETDESNYDDANSDSQRALGMGIGDHREVSSHRWEGWNYSEGGDS